MRKTCWVDMEKTEQKRLRRNDVIFIVALLAVIAIAGACLYLFRGEGNTVSVSVDGKVIVADAPIAAVAAPDDMCIRIKVPESNVQNLRVGSFVTVTGSGLDGNYNGTVDRILKIGTKNAGGSTTVDAIVTLDDADEGVISGFSVKVSIVTERVENSLIVPFSAAQNDAGGDYVYLIKGGKAEKVYFEHDVICDSGYVVKNGLISGQKIIADLSDFSGGKINVIG